MTFLHSQRFRVTLFFVIFILLLSTPKGYSSEKYYIDDSPVLLYKVINWWYHCLPEEAEFLCGKSVKWSNRGDEKISYNKEKRVLELNVTGGYASMLSAVAPCNQCDQSR
ncbi:MAG: hypothetical protein MI892_18585, partial [Desulfobacterales bacterium]|nr:hypothetical protein [Desulfobacterales bacterium]